jgi:hypothetical protein
VTGENINHYTIADPDDISVLILCPHSNNSLTDSMRRKNHMKLERNALLLAFDVYGIMRTRANHEIDLRVSVGMHWNRTPLRRNSP